MDADNVRAPSPGSGIAYLLSARALRDFGDGFVAVLLPVYLAALGFSPFQIGVIATAALLGSALMTLGIGLIGARFDYRRLLLAAASLMLATGVAMSLVDNFALVLVVAFAGTINPSAGSVSIFVPLEHAMLSRQVSDRDRTTMFSRYSLIGALSGAFGAFAAALPDYLSHTGAGQLMAIKLMLVLYALLGLAGSVLYARIAEQPPSEHRAETRAWAVFGTSSTGLPPFFALDAFAGGFVVQSLLALWLFRALPPITHCRQSVLLLVGRAVCVLISGSGVDFPAYRSGQYNGVHARSIEHLPRSCRGLTEPDCCASAVACPRGAVADGRPHPLVISNGGRHATRAVGGC